MAQVHYYQNQSGYKVLVVSGPRAQRITIGPGDVVEGAFFGRYSDLADLGSSLPGGASIVYVAGADDTIVTQITSGTTDIQAVAAVLTGSRLLGVLVSEGAGSAASVKIYHGTSTSGDVIARVNVPASDSKLIWFGDNGPLVGDGVFIDRTGTLELQFYTRKL